MNGKWQARRLAGKYCNRQAGNIQQATDAQTDRQTDIGLWARRARGGQPVPAKSPFNSISVFNNSKYTCTAFRRRFTDKQAHTGPVVLPGSVGSMTDISTGSTRQKSAALNRIYFTLQKQNYLQFLARYVIYISRATLATARPSCFSFAKSQPQQQMSKFYPQIHRTDALTFIPCI